MEIRKRIIDCNTCLFYFKYVRFIHENLWFIAYYYRQYIKEKNILINYISIYNFIDILYNNIIANIYI